MQNTENWLNGFDQFIQDITTPKGELEMKMKSYAVRVAVSGTVTVFVDAPDYDEAEEEAYYMAQALDLREEDLEFEVVDSEEDGDAD